MLLLTVVGANAAVPSISTSDTTQTESTTASTGATVSDDFKIFIVETPESTQQVISNLYDFVNATEQTQPPARYFSEETQQMIQEKLLDNASLDSLAVNEIVSLKVENYDTAYGDVTVEFSFATEYEIGKAVVVLLGLTDAAGNIEWIAVDAVAVEGGGLSAIFPQDVLLKMEQSSAVTMVVFNEQ
jgi:hypothetical protein